MSDFPPPDDNMASLPEQAQPHSREAEEAVLGAVLIHPEVYYEVAQILSPEDFYIVRNRWIWEAFMRLTERRADIDYMLVIQELENQGQIMRQAGRHISPRCSRKRQHPCTPWPTRTLSKTTPFGAGC